MHGGYVHVREILMTEKLTVNNFTDSKQKNNMQRIETGLNLQLCLALKQIAQLFHDIGRSIHFGISVCLSRIVLT